jgi:hypothetical protein
MSLAADVPARASDRSPASAIRRALRTSLPPFTRGRVTVLEWILRLATAGAFIGHGAYGAFMEKPGWYGFFTELGYTRAEVDANNLMQWAGGFEMALGVLALVAPVPGRSARSSSGIRSTRSPPGSRSSAGPTTRRR